MEGQTENFTPIFHTFFLRKIPFRGKFRGISWKNDFSKLFPWKIQFFPNIFGGKFSAEFSPEKMFEKSAPGDNFTPRGQNSPLGDNFALGVNVCP
jgi:hypothetical protein